MTRKMRRVTPVHIRRCWNGVLVSGTAISGIRGVNGFTRSRKRTVGDHNQLQIFWPVYHPDDMGVRRAPLRYRLRDRMLSRAVAAANATGEVW